MLRAEGLCELMQRQRASTFVRDEASTADERVGAEYASVFRMRLMIQISMIVSGVATILQARTKGPVGSGYLCPLSCGPAYIAASISAGKIGGLPLVFGSLIAAGLFEALLSRIMQRRSAKSSYY